jgi:hypothetical protein
MMRRTPLKRTAFKRIRRAEGPTIEREPKPRALSTLKPLHRGTYAGSTSGQPVEKEDASQSDAYMAAVRNLGFCMLCGLTCRPQFCHRDQGKGIGIKTDCREGWPGCADCHYMVGTSGRMAKEDRRALELALGEKTRAAILARGWWPKNLPMWREEA